MLLLIDLFPVPFQQIQLATVPEYNITCLIVKQLIFT